MNIEQNLASCLAEHWKSLDLPGPPRGLSSMMLKGNRKSIFLLFAKGRVEPILVLKYADDPAERYRLENEHNNLRNLSECFPSFAASLLTPIKLVELAGGLGLLRQAAPGQPLTFGVRPPTQANGRWTATFDLVYTWLVDFQETTLQAPELKDSNRKQDLVENHILFKYAEETEVQAVMEASKAVQEAFLDGTLPSVVEHGDFNPDNIYEHRSKICVIDWEWAKSPGLPLIDLFEFALHYTRMGSFLGKQRAQAVNSRHLLETFNPSGPLAPTLRRWTRQACDRLRIPHLYATYILILLISRYHHEDGLVKVVDRVHSLFSDHGEV